MTFEEKKNEETFQEVTETGDENITEPAQDAESDNPLDETGENSQSLSLNFNNLKLPQTFTFPIDTIQIPKAGSKGSLPVSKFNFNIGYKNENTRYCGSIEDAIALPNELFMYKCDPYVTFDGGEVLVRYGSCIYYNDNILADLKTYYNDNGKDASKTYSHLKDLINENKDDFDSLRYIVANLCDGLEDHYDYTMKHDYVGKNQEDILGKILDLDDHDECPALICGTIHGFVMQTLHDCGIEAVLVAGTYYGDDHATLLYKAGDKYVFTNYSVSSVIDANNIKDALRVIYASSPDLRSFGYLCLYDENGSWQKFAFKDDSVFGGEMDKSDYNNNTPFDTKPADESTVGGNIGVSNFGNLEAEVSATFAVTGEKSAKSTEISLAYRNNNNSDMFNMGSQSAGFKVEFNKDKQTKNSKLSYGIKGITTYVEGKTLGSDYNEIRSKGDYYNNEYSISIREDISDDLGQGTIDCFNETVTPIERQEIHRTNSPDKLKYLNLFLKGDFGVKNSLYSTDNVNLDNAVQLEVIANGSSNFSRGAGGDFRILAEDGLRLSSRAGNYSMQNIISGGVFEDVRYKINNHPGLQTGVKLNFQTEAFYKPSDNVSIGVGAGGYYAGTDSYKNWGGEVNASVTYKPSKNLSFTASGGVSTEQEKLTLGGFNEKTENNMTPFSSLSMNYKNTKISLDWQKYNDKLNPTKNTSYFGIGCAVSF